MNISTPNNVPPASHAPCPPSCEGLPPVAAGSAALAMNIPAAKPNGVGGGRAARNRRERERKARRRAENRRIIAREKARGCWLCSRQDLPPKQLHFHHLDPRHGKKDIVCHLVSRSVNAVIAEIRATRLICSRCHKKHHALVHSEIWQTGGCYDI